MPRYPSTCWTMVLGAAAGSPRERAAFSEQYEPVIRAYLSARWKLPQDHDRVSDATQDVFVQCFKEGSALERLDPERGEEFRAFLFGVTRHVGLMIERKDRRRIGSSDEFDLDAHQGDEASLSQVFDRAWAEMVARHARQTMVRLANGDPVRAERYRCLTMRYVKGMAPREIASKLSVDVKRVYERLREAREDYRGAVITVMREFHPDATRAELEARCRELTALL